MPIKPTPDLMQSYASMKVKYKGYQDAVNLYEDLRVHADGDTPKDVIEERRPSESLMIKDYREKIYVPITEPTISKVITSLSKIRRSQDWSISYNVDKIPAKVKSYAGESLEDYCESNYPFFGSITNWVFSVMLKAMEIDANAVQAVWPLNMNPAASEFLKPFSYLYHSDQILDFSTDDYVVVRSADSYYYQDKDQVTREGCVLYIIDTLTIQRWVQVDLDKSMRLEWSYNHELGFAPFKRLGGVFFRAYDSIFLYKSRIQGMVPRLKEAARIYSDLQAEIVQHVHSEKWLYSQTECRRCNGHGKIDSIGNGTFSTCTDCDGVGYVPTSPYKNMVLRPQTNMEQSSMPSPPAGYIQKTDVALMVEKIDGLVDKQLYQALSAINMEFLSQAPLNQSGTAKEVDKDELNNFVHSVAEDIVRNMDWLYNVINEYRYKDYVPQSDIRRAMLPSIAVPEKFDLLSSTMLLDDVSKAKSSNVNPVIQNQLQIEYASKKFYNDPKVKHELETILEMDPFPNISQDDKMAMLADKGITQVDYVISCNIQQFVRRAINENDTFTSMSADEKRSIIEEYANQVIMENSPAKDILGSNPDDPTSALRSSVGGLTGMIEIVKAVSSGVYDLDAAVSLVAQRFGITEEEARKQLGTPQQITDPQAVDAVSKLT